MKKLLTKTIIVATCALFSACDSQDSSPPGSKLGGASSTGGGYSQKGTHQMLEIAKEQLSTGILSSPDELFRNFPEDFKREEIARIIKEIEFMPKERRERDGSFLKFDYDQNKKTIIATQDFYIIYNFPSIHSLDTLEFIKAIRNIQQDILHEFSHFLKIGQSAESDFTSEVFAYYLKSNLAGIFYRCSNEKYKVAVNPYTKIMVMGNSSYDGYPFGSYDYQDDDIYDYLFSDEDEDEEFYVLEDLEDLQSSHQYHLLLRNRNLDSVYSWDRIFRDIDKTTDENRNSGSAYSIQLNSASVEEEIVTFSDNIIDDKREASYEGGEDIEYAYTLDAELSIDKKSLKAKLTTQVDVEITNDPNNLNETAREEFTKSLLSKLDNSEFEGQNFDCEFKFKPILIQPFIDYPVEYYGDENIDKIYEFIEEEE